MSDAGYDSDKTPTSANGRPNTAVAYANGGGSGRQPIFSNLTNLGHSLSAMADKVFGSSDGGEADDNNGKDKIPCYCLPFLNCGQGERGRSNVRAITTLFFPIFLLSFFLLDDFGHTIMRNIRFRNGGKSLLGGMSKSKISAMPDPVLRRKTVDVYPGIRREVMFVPLELTMDISAIDGGISPHSQVKAEMHCPRGILFLFHGCSRYAASFFYSPQGRQIVVAAYKRGIAIVAFEKKDERGCWDWEEDGEAVLKVGKKFVTSHEGKTFQCGTDKNGDSIYPPMWAFGASSGGSFIAMLANEMKEQPKKYAPFLFSALNVQIMSPSERLDWDIPTIFTVMDGDEMTKERVNDRVSKKFQGGPFKMITTSGRKSIHADHFAKVYADDVQMSKAVSHGIYQDLTSLGIIDAAKKDMLVGDPRQSADAVTSIWEKYDTEVRAVNNEDNPEDVLPFGVSHRLLRPLRKEELADANNIWLIEELNVAWDQHEITSEGFDEVLKFFFEVSGRQ